MVSSEFLMTISPRFTQFCPSGRLTAPTHGASHGSSAARHAAASSRGRQGRAAAGLQRGGFNSATKLLKADMVGLKMLEMCGFLWHDNEISNEISSEM